ncbi:hypothetical protein CN286_26665 [Bacillus anthracis]|nr:hypothetical protein CN286_26665 [Bacillus anthracis]
MREIKFRGKPIEDYGDTKWFYGNAVINYEDKSAYIEAPGQGFVPVVWESVGQFTGETDAYSNEIYEDDIVDQEFHDYRPIEVGAFTGKVEMSEGAWVISNGINHEEPLWSELNVNEVIGNIHDNPELIKN